MYYCLDLPLPVAEPAPVQAPAPAVPTSIREARAAWHTARRAYHAADDAAWEYISQHPAPTEAEYRGLCALAQAAARVEMAAFAHLLAAEGIMTEGRAA